MTPGALNRRVIIQSPAGTRDSYGERTTTWTNVATVWAAIEPLSVRETFAAAQMQAATTHRVTIRYSALLAAIDASWRVSYDSRVFVLTGPPRNLGEANQWLELLCQEGMRTE